MNKRMISCVASIRRSPLLFKRKFNLASDLDGSPKRDPVATFDAGVTHHHLCNTAFPIAHRRTLTPYRVPGGKGQGKQKEVIKSVFSGQDHMMLYVHLPFCHTRCDFCEYTVLEPTVGRSPDVHTAYVDAVLREMNIYADLLDGPKRTIVGLDVGGGTPSLVSAYHIDRILEAARRLFDFSDDPQISIETTPVIASSELDKLRAYRAMGIGRISMGVQTTDFREQKAIARDDANEGGVRMLHRAVSNVRNAGFQSFNVDLMYGFPIRAAKQTGAPVPGLSAAHAIPGDTFPKTVHDAVNLGVDHVTLYRMRYKGTKMSHLQSRVSLEQINRQEAAARELLLGAGFTSMVGKNTYSKIDSGCSPYLDLRVRKGIPYLGFGLGAQSFAPKGLLTYNLGAVTKRLEQYIASCEINRIPIQDLYHLSNHAAAGKFCAVSFYYGGIDAEAFMEIFGQPLDVFFRDECEFVTNHALMEWQENEYGRRLQLTAAGKSVYGGVIAQFYSPAVKDYIASLDPGLGELFPEAPSRLLCKRPKLSSAGARTTLSGMGAPRLYSTFATTSSHAKTHPATNEYLFGNILFQGRRCNQKCFFCIGGDQSGNAKFGEFVRASGSNLRQWPLPGISQFITEIERTGTPKVIVTGTNTDPQLAKTEQKLLELLRNELGARVHISLHTNGIQASTNGSKWALIKYYYDSVTVSVNSFDPILFRKLHGVARMPDVPRILRAGVPVKLSCVLVEGINCQPEQLLQYAAEARRLGVRRVAFRYLFGSAQRWPLPTEFGTPVRRFQGNPVYQWRDVEITVWTFENVQSASLNLFADGSISPSYHLINRVTAR